MNGMTSQVGGLSVCLYVCLREPVLGRIDGSPRCLASETTNLVSVDSALPRGELLQFYNNSV